MGCAPSMCLCPSARLRACVWGKQAWQHHAVGVAWKTRFFQWLWSSKDLDIAVKSAFLKGMGRYGSEPTSVTRESTWALRATPHLLSGFLALGSLWWVPATECIGHRDFLIALQAEQPHNVVVFSAVPQKPRGCSGSLRKRWTGVSKNSPHPPSPTLKSPRERHQAVLSSAFERESP